MLLHISMFLNLIDEEKDCAKDFGKKLSGDVEYCAFTCGEYVIFGAKTVFI